jgi:hypothetical protein
MPGSYVLFIRREVYSILHESSRTARNRVVSFIEALSANPFQSGDYSEKDSTGRDCQVKIIGKYAVFFWADHAGKEIKIVDMIDADKD